VNRKILVCSLIIIAAVAITATTAAIRGVSHEESRDETEQPQAQGVTRSTLSETEIRSALGDNAILTTSRFGRLTKAPATVDPLFCEGVSSIMPPGLLGSVEWVAIRGVTGTSPSGQHFHYVAQGLMGLATSAAAREYLEKSRQSWRGCNGHTYSTDSSGKISHWYMKSFNESDTTMTAAISLPENSRYLCQHVLTTQTKYVIDVEACGYDILDQGRAIANRIADKLQKNLATG
jgi:hypothetical protein